MALMERAGFDGVRYRLLGGASVALHVAEGRREHPRRSSGAPLDDYLDAVEERLAVTVASHPGVVAAVGADALAAGGKRLRPLLTSPSRTRRAHRSRRVSPSSSCTWPRSCTTT